MSDAAAPATPSVLQRVTNGGLDRLAGGPVLAPGSERPAMLVALACGAVFVAGLAGLDPLGLAVSGQALAEGRWHTLLTHMFVHGGAGHLIMNLTALLAFGPVVTTRLGRGPGGWLRFFGLYLGAGLAGAALYLALHPTGAVPMVGASGAIFGLWGAAARLHPDGDVLPLRAPEVRREVVAALKVNLILFALLFVIVRLSGGVGGLAWEAHLGGFLVGLLLAPRLVARAPAPTPDRASPPQPPLPPPHSPA